MTLYGLLLQLASEVKTELVSVDPADSIATAKAIAKADLLRRANELLAATTAETIETGDSEHSILEPVPTVPTKPEKTDPI